MKKISVKNRIEIEIMREAGRKLAEIMEKLTVASQPGISTLEIDSLAEKLVLASGGKPAFKGYRGGGSRPFPATICASLNDEVVHGIPRKDVFLKEGDLFKIDIGMERQGFFTDMARTIPIGKVSFGAEKIIAVAEECFFVGVKKMKKGTLLSDYSRSAQKCVEKSGFSVVRNLVGHGIGKKLHEDPQIPNYFNKNFSDFNLQSGMTFALEPMINAGTFETFIGEDGWVFKTKDGSLSAHYENTVLITENGVEILTLKK